MKQKKTISSLFDNTAESLRETLGKQAKEHLVCGPDSDLVIEAYPRSGNTFTLDMLNVLQQDTQVPKLKFAHHTHRVENLLIGSKLNKPILVLIRKPEDAILSFAIFSDRDVEFAAQRYFDFYSAVLQLEPRPVVFPFETVVSDFNRIVDAVNAATGGHVPRTQDVEADVARARERATERGKKLHGDQFSMRIAMPNADREEVKRERRSQITDFLNREPDIQALYEQVLAVAE